MALAAAALGVRYLAWAGLGGPIRAVDSVTYYSFAQAIAHGDFSEFARLPFYLLYPLTLAPMYAWSLAEPGYIKWLHLLASTATVLVLARIGARLFSERAGLALGAAAAVYPFFLFWLPYVLTETLFLCCLAAYTHAYLRLLEAPGAASARWYAVASAVFVVSRPSAVVCLAFSWLVLGASLAARRWGVGKGIQVVAAASLACALAGSAALAASPRLRSRVLSMPTIGQTLWASTKYATGTIEELRGFEALDQEMHARFDGPNRERDEYAYKVREAAGFIARHPIAYLGMAARKMAAYWFPWAFASSWSAAHRVLDALVSVGLTIGALLSMRRRAVPPWPLAGLVAMFGAFALLSAFGQVDPDARYRLPAELLALIVAAGVIGAPAPEARHPAPGPWAAVR